MGFPRPAFPNEQNGFGACEIPTFREFAHLGRGPWVVVAALAGAMGLRERSRSRLASENPVANATFTRLTNFEGAEHGAAICPDGKWVAFRADRDGPFDVWLSQIGTGRFLNLTQEKS